MSLQRAIERAGLGSADVSSLAIVRVASLALADRATRRCALVGSASSPTAALEAIAEDLDMVVSGEAEAWQTAAALIGVYAIGARDPYAWDSMRMWREYADGMASRIERTGCGLAGAADRLCAATSREQADAAVCEAVNALERWMREWAPEALRVDSPADQAHDPQPDLVVTAETVRGNGAHRYAVVMVRGRRVDDGLTVHQRDALRAHRAGAKANKDALSKARKWLRDVGLTTDVSALDVRGL